VAGSSVVIAGVEIRLDPALLGPPRLFFDRLPEGIESLDGISVSVAQAAGSTVHPNGAVSIDQVVIATPDFDRTSEALAQIGLPLRREAVRPADDESQAQIRQGFVRAGGPVIELVHTDRVPEGPAHVWGIGFISETFDQAIEDLDGVIGAPRPAVQQGRRIATFSRDARLGLPVVLLDPEPGG
jgi:hypothetical protein